MFQAKKYLSLRNTFIFFSVMGSTLVLLFSRQNQPLAHQFGYEAIPFFFPPLIVTLFFSIHGEAAGFNRKLLFTSILLFFLLCIPVWDQLFKTVQPNKEDDFEKTVTYAQNMIQNKTLWGGDQLIFKKEGRSFVMQPGFRYFVALEIWICNGLYRIISIINLLLFTISLFILQKTIAHVIKHKKIKQWLYALMLISVPYAAKNILMGLSEWLAILLLILSLYFYFYRNHLLLSVVFLAFIPFIRQNTLPTVVFIYIMYMLKSGARLLYLTIFLLILFLPVYHNLYYAGEWRFFTRIFEWPFLQYDKAGTINRPIGISLHHIGNNFLHYLGVDIKKGKIDFLEESFLFLWLFLFMFYYSGRLVQLISNKLLYYTITITFIILPGLLLATDYYPRFEFVNIYLIIAVFLLIYQYDHNAIIRQ